MSTINKTQANLINKMVEANKSYSQISAAMLAMDIVKDQKAADTYLASIGVEKGTRKGITDRMYAFMAETARTQVELYEWLLKNHPKSGWANRKTIDKVRVMVNSVHAKAGVTITEKLYKEEEAK